MRYRFFLFAGLFPYLLGAALAYHAQQTLETRSFFVGLLGIAFALVGVETFNEYFDPADRVFVLRPGQKPETRILLLGVAAFCGAFLAGIFLTLTRGFVVIILAFLGFLIAAFYVGPPLRLAYRGLGELGIALAYGPLMVIGSYYLQTLRIDLQPLFISLSPALLILALAIANEVPDYYQDRLVGKRNLVVRLGQRTGTVVYSFALGLGYGLVAIGIVLKLQPLLGALVFLTLPMGYHCAKIALKNHGEPQSFVAAIRGTAIIYLLLSVILIISCLV